MDSRAPPLYRLVADRSGQSNVIAVVLIAGMTIIGTGVIVALGSTAFADTKSHTSMALNEQSMSKFDAEAALVGLGRADTRSMTLGDAGGGGYRVNSNQSWIAITHHNYSGTGDEVELYNESLGAFVYKNGDTRIAYEGGGVWRTQGNNTVMVSPPEFRYRSATLTLPVIRVRGDGGGGGSTPRATITSVKQAKRIYGNDSRTYPSPPAPAGTTYDNPLQNGTVNVTVHSPHYEGWANYFETRTEGDVTVDHANETAIVQLTTPGDAVGAFQMPAEGDSLEVPAMASDHPIDTFTMNLSADNNFQNGHWEMNSKTSTGEIQFSLHIHWTGQCKNDGEYQDNKEVELTIYYNEDGAGDYQTWQVMDDPDDMPAVDVICDGDGGHTQLDLTSDQDITYQEPSLTGTDNKYSFEPAMDDGSLRDPHDPTAHPSADDPIGNLTDGKTENTSWVINHYFSLLGPEFELTVIDGPASSERVDEGDSFGQLDYDTVAGSEYIQYLHVTENEIRVVISA